PIAEMRSLPRFVAETKVGKRVKVEVWRKGRSVTLYATLGEFPKAKPLRRTRAHEKKKDKEKSVNVLGLTLAVINDELRNRFKLNKGTKGIIITDVKNNSPASEKGITPGSIIRNIGVEQKRVSSPGSVRVLVESARKAKRKSLLFLIEQGGSSRFVALRLSKDKD
ncbi:MAG: serine protease, partial [Pseudomonadota bacterium]|nr:serine protease [Pseudomonadota bacterium]